jgi:hypothetical protein
LIGVSDGAIWIEEKFKTLGVTKHVLDVFHSAMYVDTVMQALGPIRQSSGLPCAGPGYAVTSQRSGGSTPLFPRLNSSGNGLWRPLPLCDT